MKQNEYIELIKTHLNNSGLNYSIQTENFYGPHWHIEIESNSYKVKIAGDIGFNIEVSDMAKTYSLWKIDRSLISKSKTTSENIITQLNTLLPLIK